MILYDKQIEAYLKAQRVIKSCTKGKYLLSTLRYIKNYKKLYGDTAFYKDLLYRYDKMKTILVKRYLDGRQ